MASPLTHAAAGWAILQLVRPHLPTAKGVWPTLVLAAGILAAALCMDADAIPGIIHHDLGHYHNQQSHSLLVAIITGLGIGFLGHRLAGGGLGRWMATGCAATLSHVVIDFLTIGRGLQLFWPLTATRYTSPLPIFYGLHWSEGIWSAHHLISLANELPIVIGLLWLVHHLSRHHKGEHILKS